ncbi:MAG TPA: hypothetical protein VMF03_03450 [Steroidobacteraceae bacterium]|nr:hypothetical protein [Steroidobacteraceae bacterium]
MRARIGTLLLGLMSFCLPAFAANVDGDWSGSIDAGQGPIQISYSFKTEGAKLTGTTTGPDGSKLAIKDGKVDGDKISFSVDVDMGGNAMTFKYTGVVSADSIALTTDFQGMPINITVKKAAAQPAAG